MLRRFMGRSGLGGKGVFQGLESGWDRLELEMGWDGGCLFWGDGGVCIKGRG